MTHCGLRISDCGLKDGNGLSPYPLPFRNPKSAIRNRNAFTLLEILIVLALLAAFALVAARLFTSLMRQMRDAKSAQAAAAQYDSALARLRDDVWTADRIQAQPTTLILTHGSQTVTWLSSPNGPLSRTTTDTAAVTSQLRWPSLPAHLTFSTDGPSLCLLHVQDRTTTDTVPLLSQSALLQSQGATP